MGGFSPSPTQREAAGGGSGRMVCTCRPAPDIQAPRSRSLSWCAKLDLNLGQLPAQPKLALPDPERSGLSKVLCRRPAAGHRGPLCHPRLSKLQLPARTLSPPPQPRRWTSPVSLLHQTPALWLHRGPRVTQRLPRSQNQSWVARPDPWQLPGSSPGFGEGVGPDFHFGDTHCLVPRPVPPP